MRIEDRIGDRTGREELIERLALLVLVLLYLATVLPHLADDPIAGGDEGWIISAAAKLATGGAFGSDLFAGFYGADQHYFFNLPLHHFILGGVFELTSVGLEAARLVSAGYGLATLLLTYALAKRLRGPRTGLLAAALLLLLRLNLTPFSGLTLTDLGATVRYDLIAVPYGLAAVILLARRPYDPRVPQVILAGLLLGLAALTQFIGALFAVPAGLYLLTIDQRLGRRVLLASLLAAMTILPLVPFGLYASDHIEDFRGQARAVEQETDLLSPDFYLRQLRDEPRRYDLGVALADFPETASEALKRPSARLALLLIAPLAALHALWRGRDDPWRRLVGFMLVGIVLQLALFESTKRFVYWVAAVPFLCVATADLAAFLWQEAPLSRLRRGWAAWRPLRWLARGLVAAVLAVFAVEGLVVAAQDIRDAPSAPSYDALGARLREVLPAGAVVLADNRLWPQLQDRNHRSLLLLFYHTNPRISRDRTTDIPGALDRVQPRYIVLSPLSREILARLTPDHHAQLDTYLAQRTELVATIEAPAYGPHQVLRVR